MAEIFDIKQARHVVQFGDLMHTTKMLARAVNEVERLRADNETLLNVVTAGDTNIVINSNEQAKRIQELESDLKYAQEGCPHGRQEHARLAAILGGNDALHVLAQQVVDKNGKLAATLIRDRTEKLAMAFAGYKPPMTMEDCERMARKQLHTEGLL